MRDIYDLTVAVENTEIMLFHVNPGITLRGAWDTATHAHALHEMFIILDGKARLKTDSAVLELDRHDVCIIPPRLFHGGSGAGETPPGRISLFLAYRRRETGGAFDFYSWMNRLPFGEAEPVVFHAGEMMVANLLEILSRLPDGRLSPVDEVKMKSIVSLLLLNVTERLPDVGDASREPYPKSGEYYRRLALMDALIDAGMTVEELAGRLFLSPRQISNIFRDEYGMSAKRYRYAAQMRRAAAELTRFPAQSVRALSETLGYGSPEIFSILFKRYFGVSPTEYRRRRSPLGR